MGGGFHSRSLFTRLPDERSGIANPAVPALSRAAPGGATAGSCTVRIAFVNAVPFHFELVGGFLDVLKEYKPCMDLYFQHQYFTGAPRYAPWWHDMTFGYQALIRDWQGQIHYASTHDPVKPADVAIFVSPEFNPDYYQYFNQRVRPQHVVSVLHEPQVPGRVARLRALTPDAHWVMLGPHAAQWAQQSVFQGTLRVEWMLPVHVLRPRDPDATAACEASAARARNWIEVPHSCFQGFAIQGKFEPKRRRYGALWQQLVEVLRDPRRRRLLEREPQRSQLRIMAAGQGSRRSLRIPEAVDPVVDSVANLTFPDFYDRLSKKVALLTLFGGRDYLESKISSSVVTSLVTGTPLLADEEFLAAYRFFSRDDVLLQRPGEMEVDAMLRILDSPPSEVMKVRANLRRVRERLNFRTLELLRGMLHLPPPPPPTATSGSRAGA